MNIKISLASLKACLFKFMHDVQWCRYRYYRHVVECCVINGSKTIIYRPGLKHNNAAYHDLTRYAQRHGYQLKEDQRREVKRVTCERRTRHASMLVLTFGLFTENAVLADSQDVFAMQNNSALYQQEIYIDNEIHELLAWITQKISPYNPDVTVTLPRLMNLPRQELYKMAFGKDWPLSVDKVNSRIYGLYNFQDETIYLLDSVDLNTNKGKSILLHELVHYIQYKNGYHNRVMCKNQLEYLAYYLEAQYMQEQGERVSFTQDHLRRVVRCAN